jgi:DNA-binding NarL/FixJ family response regulator
LIQYFLDCQWETLEIMASRATSSAETKSGRPPPVPVGATALPRPPIPAAAASKPAGQCQPAPAVKPFRIALVDDDPSIHVAMRQTFRALAAGWTLESYLDGNQAVDCITQIPPRAVLMDITMPEISGIECTRKIKALLPDLPVVIFTARTDTDSFISSMIAGASGYVVKPSSPSETVSAVQKAVDGLPVLCVEAEKTIIQWLRSLGEKVSSWGLTAREQQIMLQVCSNRCDKDIARLLKISPATVHVHLHSLYKKLDVKGRNEARRKFIGLNA